MASWCDRCPYPGRFCHGTIFPERCEAISGGEPTGRTAPAAPPPSQFLAGDMVAAATARLGVDRLVRWIEARAGAPCGCESRRRRLNELDAKLRRYLGRG